MTWASIRTFCIGLLSLCGLTACAAEVEDICVSARAQFENCDASFGPAEETLCQTAKEKCSADDEERASRALSCLSGKECNDAALIACSGELEGISAECQQAVLALAPN